MRFCRLSLRHEGILGIGRLVVSLFRWCVTFCKEYKFAVDDICWGTGKMISDLNGSLGSGHFLNVANERTWFASCGCAFKVPGWSLVWNALLTKKLPMFLSRLIEINQMEVAKRFYQYRHHFQVILHFLEWRILLPGCEGEWNPIILLLRRF